MLGAQQVPFDVSTGSARYVFLTKGLGRGLFKEELQKGRVLLLCVGRSDGLIEPNLKAREV